MPRLNIDGISKHINWSCFEENINIFRLPVTMAVATSIMLHRFIIVNKYPPFLIRLMMVFAGISLFNVFQQILISFSAAWAFSSLIPFGLSSLVFFALQWFSCFITCYIISNLINTHIRDYKNTQNFIKTLVRTIESKDDYTAYHSMNVARYAKAIAEKLNYSKRECSIIFMGALLHDIGKVGINDSILNKPSKLTKEEYMYIKQHPVIGYNMLEHNLPFHDRKILDMILYHHERYDGTGYPNKLKGVEIPQCAAIIAVADAFDAMTSKRVYHDEYDLSYATDEIRRNAGFQFDPMVADAFLEYITEHTENINLDCIEGAV